MMDSKTASGALLRAALAALAVALVLAPAVGGQQVRKDTGAPAKHITILDDIPYRLGPSHAWRLDMAMPEDFGAQVRPALVIIHGGGWGAGTKQDRPYRSMLLDFALKGYVTVSVEYRLTGEAPFPAGLEDVDCAVRWVRAHAREYRIDPNRIGAFGHSAGAHLAVMLASSPPAPPIHDPQCEWNDFSDRLTSVVGGSTPTVFPARLGDSKRYSPASWVSNRMPPILLIHGTEDNIVPVAQVDDYVEKLEAAGAPDVTYVRIEGGNHGVAYEHFMDRATAAITKFFARTLKP